MIPALFLALILLSAPCAGGMHSASRDDSPKIVKDSLGRTVSVPHRIERVLSLQPEVTRIVVALGAGGRLVGRDDFMARFDHLFPLIFPSQDKLPVVSSADGFPNLELVLRLAPDLVFASPSEADIPDVLQRKSGKPVLAFSSMGRFEDLIREIRWVGAALGREERAEELAAFMLRTLDRVKSRLEGVRDDQKPRVYLSFWSSLTRSPVFYEPVNAAGGRNLAQGLLPARLGSVAAEVNIEKILAWDPEIVLIQGNYLPAERLVSVEGILNDSRLRSLRAVREGKVFYTFGFWYWWDPALVLVETMMLAQLFHPERFRDLDLVSEGNAVFKMFYGLENGYDALRRTLAVPDGPWR